MAPYGIPSELGGDSKENVRWMEKCVARLIEQGRDKVTAIKICKSQFKKKKLAELEKKDVAQSG
jgi:hypothetical protein